MHLKKELSSNSLLYNFEMYVVSISDFKIYLFLIICCKIKIKNAHICFWSFASKVYSITFRAFWPWTMVFCLFIMFYFLSYNTIWYKFK